MKKIITLLSITVLLTACGNQKEQTIDEIIVSGNLEGIQKKRDDFVVKQQEINAQIKELDEVLVQLNPEKNMPLITYFTAKDTLFKHYIEIQGSVKTDQNILITPEIGGVLDQVYVVKGQQVNKGELLATIDDGGMSKTLAQIQVQTALTKTTFERQERLWSQNIGSEIQFLQAKTAYEGQLKAVDAMKQQVAKALISAPFSGTIDDIITEQGTVVAPGQTPIMRIVNLNNMYIRADVPETYIRNVIIGKEVAVFIPVLGETIAAKISQTGSFINPNNRTFKAEINVPNKEKSIKPNLTARLKINDYTNQKAILIPQSIISENAEGDQYIYVLKEISGDKAMTHRVIIETGRKQGDIIEVLSGLQNGDQIIKEGARSVEDAQSVKIITY
ncbi:MAG: membrane fusion protein (multidrug efflux system) [Saprospiraceae bacterium]|jgi:membrane fusion protein (multidrug efflux system)